MLYSRTRIATTALAIAIAVGFPTTLSLTTSADAQVKREGGAVASSAKRARYAHVPCPLQCQLPARPG